MKQIIELKVNGEVHEVAVNPYDRLLRVLRDTLGLTGAKKGCDNGGCGCCTVLLDGRAVYSCLTFAIAAAGSEITTIEGLQNDTALDPLQKQFVESGAVQCGYCTCGMIMAAKEFLANAPSTEESDIRKAISGNLCRCTGYRKIVDAIKASARHSGAEG